MCERLREVAEVLSARTDFLRVEPKMVSVAQEFLKQQLSLFQLPSARQALDVPKRACSEAALSPREPVHVRTFRFIAMDQRIFDQSCFDRLHCRAPHWIDRADKPHEDRKSTRLNSSHVEISYA